MKAISSLILCILNLCGCAGPAPSAWDANKIVASPATYVRLTDAKAQSAATIEIQHVRRLIAVKDRLVAVASQAADVFVMSGKEPNAASTYQNGKPIIVVNLGMMDLLQNDD